MSSPPSESASQMGFFRRNPDLILWIQVVGSIVAIILILLAVVAKVSPIDALTAIVRGSVGSGFSLANTLVRGIPIAFVAVGAGLALRAGVINVGGEGQMAMGAMGGFVVLILWPEGPALLLWPLAAVAGFIVGAAWALIPAWMAVKRGTSEILSTLLMNFVGLGIVTWAVLGSWMHDPSSVTSQSKPIEVGFQLPILWPGTRLHAGLVVLVAVVGIASWYEGTRSGFLNEIQGANPRLARLAGVNVERSFAALLLVSAGVAGLAGTIQIIGASYRLTPGVTAGVGFTGLLVAVLGRGRPVPSALIAFLFAALLTSGDQLEAVGAARPLVLVIQALIVIAISIQRVVVR